LEKRALSIREFSIEDDEEEEVHYMNLKKSKKKPSKIFAEPVFDSTDLLFEEESAIDIGEDRSVAKKNSWWTFNY